MKAFVKAGRWHVSGASWDATDTLVPSVESFIRNIMLGQEVYRKELADQLAEYGADRVIVVDDPQLKEYQTIVFSSSCSRRFISSRKRDACS